MKLHLKTDCPYLVPRYDFWGALIGAGVALGTTVYNAFSQKKTEKKKEEYADQANEFTREQFDYNKQLNAELMAREDNAYQRAVADARAAGLSPLVTAGTGGAGAGGTVSHSNLSMQSPNLQAPQVESNTFASMINSLEQQYMQDRQLSAQSASQESAQSHEMIKLNAELDARREMLDRQIASTENQQEKQLAQDWKKFTKGLQLTVDSKNADFCAQVSKDMVDYARSLGVTEFEYFDNFDAYKAAMMQRSSAVGEEWNAMYDSEVSDNEGYETEEQSDAASSSTNVSGSVSGSVGIPGSSVGSELSAGSVDSSGKNYKRTSSAFSKASSSAVKQWNKQRFPVFVPRVSR